MSNRQAIPLVLALDDASATLDTVGGKGASLARMAAAGLPVPPGFHITTAAYRRFVAEQTLLGFAVDRAGDWLPRSQQHRAGGCEPGGGGTGTGASRPARAGGAQPCTSC